MAKSSKKSSKPAAKKPAPRKYIAPVGQIGTGVIPVTPPIDSAEARRQLRGY